MSWRAARFDCRTHGCICPCCCLAGFGVVSEGCELSAVADQGLRSMLQPLTIPAAALAASAPSCAAPADTAAAGQAGRRVFASPRHRDALQVPARQRRCLARAQLPAWIGVLPACPWPACSRTSCAAASERGRQHAWLVGRAARQQAGTAPLLALAVAAELRSFLPHVDILCSLLRCAARLPGRVGPPPGCREHRQGPATGAGRACAAGAGSAGGSPEQRGARWVARGTGSVLVP